MRVKLRQVGNSVGLTIPAAELRAIDAEAGDEVELEITRVVRHPRSDWQNAASWPGAETELNLLDEDASTDFDEEEWQW